MTDPRLQPYRPGQCFVCGHPCSRSFLMCRPHWRMVPPELRAGVLQTSIRTSDGQAVREAAAVAVLDRCADWAGRAEG